MNSNITVYESYRNGKNTVNGSFPLYNNTAAFSCYNKLITTSSQQNLISLDESYNRDNILMEAHDLYDGVNYCDNFTDVPLLIDIDYTALDPNDPTGVLTYILLIQ